MGGRSIHHEAPKSPPAMYQHNNLEPERHGNLHYCSNPPSWAHSKAKRRGGWEPWIYKLAYIYTHTHTGTTWPWSVASSPLFVQPLRLRLLFHPEGQATWPYENNNLTVQLNRGT